MNTYLAAGLDGDMVDRLRHILFGGLEGENCSAGAQNSSPPPLVDLRFGLDFFVGFEEGIVGLSHSLGRVRLRPCSSMK